MNNPLQCQLEPPARQDRQNAYRRKESQGLQYQVDYDLLLQLHLLSPPSVESAKLLLRSQAITEDTQDALLSTDPLQSLDSVRSRLSSGCSLKASGFCLQPYLITGESSRVVLSQLLSLRKQCLPIAQRAPC